MRYRVLGPLEVSDGDGPVPLGEGQQRSVLTLLLLHRNEAVSRDRLIDALWGDRPPATAAKVLQNHIGHLRRALDDREGKRLTTRGHGYQLAVADGDLDVDCFDRLVDEGTVALESDRPADAAALLREGLALWRGPPLADVAYEAVAQGEIGRLEERHIAALEQRIDADLALGRHADLVAELEPLIAAHPLRERLRAQLMVALYRCGRQADALEAYGDARRALLDELGVEPGPALRDLQAAILRQAPELAPAPRAWPRPARPARRQLVLLAVGGALLTGAGVAAALLAAGDSGTQRSRLGANAVAAIDLEDGSVAHAVDVGPSPSHLAAGGRALWVTNADGRSVSRIDLEDRAVRQTVTVGRGPAGLVVAGGFTWVANSRDGTVSRIDGNTNQVVQTIPVGANPTGVAAGLGAVWVANSGDQTISRIDPRTGRERRLDVHAEPTALAVGAGGLWMTSSSARAVVQIDPGSGRVLQSIPVGGGASGIAVTDRAVWVANSHDGTVSRVDPATGTVLTTIAVGNGPDSIAAGPGGVWVGERFGGSVDRIDPDSNRVVDRISVGHHATGLALADGSLWVATQSSGDEHRGGTLRVLATSEDFDALDPALAYTPGSVAIAALTGDGLTAVQHAAGRDGMQIVPDLAVSLLAPQDGGRTYRFVLRPGIRYSTGGEVRARDVRPSFERLWRLRPYREFTSPGRDFFDAIVGAGQCTRQPGTCDLSRGIVTEAGNDSVVTFHLSRPDPEFLYKLALNSAFILPAETPPRASDLSPVPATGPYAVQSYDRGQELVLTRNPRFREWSQAARPDCYPDRIVVRFDVPPSRQVDTILRGRADTALGGVDPTHARELLTQRGAQTHVEPRPTVAALTLNTRTPPFDDERVRRALNHAIDRRAIVRAVGGSAVAGPTCQILPPNFPGYVRYCPYGAPDLRTARRLVAASGTAGMPVVVRTLPFFSPAAERIVALLRRLGYEARLKVIPDAYAFFHQISDSRVRAQAGIFRWVGDYPAPSNFLEQLSCRAFTPASEINNMNYAEFCEPAIDAKMRAAARMQSINPQRANRLWAGVDRALVDAAPWVPLYNVRSVELVSRRVGGYRFSPIYGTLLDQLWGQLVSAVTVRAIPHSVLVGLAVAALPAPYDFDGDGRQSLTAGLPLSGTANAGAIVTWEDNLPRRLVQGSRDMPGRSELGDRFGWAVTSADFDGDGFADLAVGAPGEQPGGSRRRYGAVTILPGSPDGLTTAGARQILGPRPSEPGSPSEFGQALATADFNRDGFADLAVGAPGAATVEEASGAVELLFGGPDGLTATGRQVIARPHARDGFFGAMLATGDLDGDGHADLIESGSFFRAHQYWCRGSAAGPTACRALRQNADTAPSYMAAGDVTGDGYQDLVNGIEVWRDLPPRSGDRYPVGAIEVWPGGPKGPQRPIVITQNGPGVPGSDRAEETSDSFGSVFTLGDFDGDRFADLAIAAPTRVRRHSLGALVVLHGARSGYRRGGEVYTSRRLRVPKANRRLAPISLALLDGDGDRKPELTLYAAGVADRGVLVSIPVGTDGLAVRRARALRVPHTTDGEFPDFGPFPFLSIRLLALVASDLSGGHHALSSPL